MPMLWTVFSPKGFHQINEGTNISGKEMYNNYNISRRYALVNGLSRETTKSSEYVDISVSELRVFNQCSKPVDIATDIDFAIYRSTNTFSDNDTEHLYILHRAFQKGR